MVLKFKWKKGVKEVYPAHPMVQNWLFTQETEDEAILANQMAVLAEKTGMTANDLQHIFPAVLRMLKNQSNWSGMTTISNDEITSFHGKADIIKTLNYE